uniref:Uncharacterized protein n=1 Tax=Physcomitrium patens TaxID=3218 RepID=A0A7I4DSD8_PHYPA
MYSKPVHLGGFYDLLRTCSPPIVTVMPSRAYHVGITCMSRPLPYPGCKLMLTAKGFFGLLDHPVNLVRR